MRLDGDFTWEESQPPALVGIDLSIKQGDLIAVVGSTGELSGLAGAGMCNTARSGPGRRQLLPTAVCCCWSMLRPFALLAITPGDVGCALRSKLILLAAALALPAYQLSLLSHMHGPLCVQALESHPCWQLHSASCSRWKERRSSCMGRWA